MKVKNAAPAQFMHGKPSKDSNGYYYVTPTHKQKYRERQEIYQQNQSPRQKWNSLAFADAHKQIQVLWKNPEQVELITQQWKDAMRIGPNNRTYEDAKGWKFACLQDDWKTAHPYEAWYTDYLQAISAKAAEKTEKEHVSDFMLRHQAEILEAQAAELRAQLAARHPQTQQPADNNQNP